jgi:hypothetical protein
MKIKIIHTTRPILFPSYPDARIDYCLVCESYKAENGKEYCKKNGKDCFRFLKGKFTKYEEFCKSPQCFRKGIKKDPNEKCWFCGR